VRLFLAVILVWLCAGAALAHEVRPAFLSLTETAPAEFSVLWKQPVMESKRLRIRPGFPETCTQTTPKLTRNGGTVNERSRLTSCLLTEGEITLTGLERTLTDVFVQINYLNGEARTALIKPAAPRMALGGKAQSPARHYLRIGIDHILKGWDHLLFVIGLTLLVARRQILGVATAFTLAHSITLALAAFGLLNVPARPVEILIAASIVLLGVEIIRKQRGQKSLAAQRPYLISFTIGLLHGCGFASALAEIGLPKGTELLALLLFNLGVELGQFAVIGAAVVALYFIAKAGKDTLRKTETLATYALASTAMFWVIQRLGEYWV
jgi:hydrogenase/urease accessory protein HupE